MSDILENALDSLRFGISIYVNTSKPTANKHAILNIYHSLELILKEKLFRINPVLIYKNIDAKIREDSITVGLSDIAIRLENLGIAISKEHIDILNDLKRRRNKIEHHKFEEDDTHSKVLEKSLKFIHYFLTEHLNESLEIVLDDDDLYNKIRQMIFEYDELLRDALYKAREWERPKTKDDLCDSLKAGECPKCGNRTVTVNSDRGNFCLFCNEEVEVVECDSCGEYYPQADIEFGMCPRCYEYRLDKF